MEAGFCDLAAPNNEGIPPILVLRSRRTNNVRGLPGFIGTTNGADSNLRPNLRSEDRRCGGFFVLQGRRIEEPPVIFEEFRIPIFEEPPIFEEAPSHLRRTRSHLRSSAPKNEEPFPIFDLRGRRTKSPPPVTIIGAEERRAPIFNLRSSAPKIEEALRRNITCRNMSNRKDRPITVKVARGEK